MKLVLCVMCVLVLQFATAFAQNPNYWQRTSGPTYDGWYELSSNLVATPNGDVFALAMWYYGYSIFRTTDNGLDWSELDTLTLTNVAILGADGNGTLYAANCLSDWSPVFDSLYTSTNNGDTWTGVYGIAGGPFTSVNAMVFPGSGVWMIGTNNGVYVSTNGGVSWVHDSGLGTDNIAMLGTDASGNIYAEAEYSIAYELFRSTAAGTAWTLVGAGLFNSGYGITSFASMGNDFFAGCYDGIYCSLDSGATWNVVKSDASSPTGILSLAVDGAGNMFAGTGTGVYESVDSGATWTAMNKGLTQAIQAPRTVSIVISAGDYLFATTPDSGVYRSVDSTKSTYTVLNFWEFLNGPFGTGSADSIPLAIVAIVNAPDHSISAACGAGIMRTTDNGATWTQTLKNYYTHSFTLGPNNYLYACSEESYIDAETLYSTDYGQTWDTLNQYLGIMQIAFDNLGNMFALTADSGIMRSTDYGNSWNAINKGLPLDYGWSSIAIDTNNVFFIAQGEESMEGVYRSVDHGNTWISVNYGLEDDGMEMYNLVSGKRGYLFGSNYGLVYSTNEGMNWMVDNGAIGVYPTSIAIDSSGDVFVSTSDEIIRSTDNGVHWVEADNGIPDTAMGAITFSFGSDGHAYAGTQHGVYRSIYQSASDTGTRPSSVKEQCTSSLIPSTLLLCAYPNPAQANATLQFSLPQSAHVTLIVSDILGNSVATLESGGQHSAGTYQVKFTTENLQAGVYFCSLRAGSLVKTMELMVTK